MSLARVEEWTVRGLERFAKGVRGSAGGAKHLETGIEGEIEALFYLRRVGYTVVARRWTSAKVRGDLDLVAWHGGILCFVEVKSRTARDGVAAETAVDRGKRIQLRRLAAAYLKAFDEAQRNLIVCRFDVLSVYLLSGKNEYEMLDGAFGWTESA